MLKASTNVSKGLLVLLAIGISAFAAHAQNFHNAPASVKQLKNPYEGQPPAAPKRLFHLKCARCHGENGEGSGNIPSLTSEKIKSVTPGELFWYITKGDINDGMPSWATLPKRQRWQIVNYVKSLAASPGEGEKSKAEAPQVAANLNLPPPAPQWVYVANMKSVVRFPYKNGDLKARGSAQHIADLPGGEYHWTRDIQFSLDGKKMFVSIGSNSNVDDPDSSPGEKNTADILQFNPDGSGMRVYASGIRNPVGLAIQPKTGDLWCSTNERDGLGDNLVPDYITHVQEGGFYGWPWWYMGGHQDPRHKGKHPELKDKVITPDVLVHPHNASLELTFYDGKQFPAEYQGEIFAAEHGSWNRSVRVGYELIRVPLHQTGHATGEYEDFMTGFVVDNKNVWGRPVGLAVATDGSLLVTDDGSNSIWRISYTGK